MIIDLNLDTRQRATPCVPMNRTMAIYFFNIRDGYR